MRRRTLITAYSPSSTWVVAKEWCPSQWLIIDLKDKHCVSVPSGIVAKAYAIVFVFKLMLVSHLLIVSHGFQSYITSVWAPGRLLCGLIYNSHSCTCHTWKSSQGGNTMVDSAAGCAYCRSMQAWAGWANDAHFWAILPLAKNETSTLSTVGSLTRATACTHLCSFCFFTCIVMRSISGLRCHACLYLLLNSSSYSCITKT